MLVMSNQSYLSVWYADLPEGLLLERFGAFLATVPLSDKAPGFTQLAIHAVSAAEIPVLEQDLRQMPLDVAGIMEIARNHLNSDCAYDVAAIGTFPSLTPHPENGKSSLSRLRSHAMERIMTTRSGARTATSR